MRPTRKPKKDTPTRSTQRVTARLYACGHEHVTPTPPADACPTCGAEKHPAHDDARFTRVTTA